MDRRYIAILNYNMGNIKSVENAFLHIGARIVVTDDKKTIENASALILPGVGAYKDAMFNLEKSHLAELIFEQIGKKPFLGICLGLQLLFDRSFEDGKNSGLGIFKGNVERIPAGVKIPHMGWNQIRILKRQSMLFKGIEDLENFYFVHSYSAVCSNVEDISSYTDYGVDIVASVEKENVYGLQFHPEKSSLKGLKILQNFWDLTLEKKK